MSIDIWLLDHNLETLKSFLRLCVCSRVCVEKWACWMMDFSNNKVLLWNLKLLCL